MQIINALDNCSIHYLGLEKRMPISRKELYLSGPVYRHVDAYSPYSHAQREPIPRRDRFDRHRDESDLRGEGARHRPEGMYEETVYGMVPGDGYSPPAERPVSSFPGELATVHHWSTSLHTPRYSAIFPDCTACNCAGLHADKLK